MQPDLPWNVAGIPPEAREAARAAARREGLSVGEWLTRHILKSLTEAGEAGAWARTGMSDVRVVTGQPNGPAGRNTEEMLDRLARTEAEATIAYRKIDEQLRTLARRMETTERTQTENSRAVNQAASEINVASREQAEAFDQLGQHVTNLGDRVTRLERSAAADGVKDAVKGLHSGVSRLADQITEANTQSAGQFAALNRTVEAVTGKLNDFRAETNNAQRVVTTKLHDFEERLRASESTSLTSQDKLERAIAESAKLNEFRSEANNAQRALTSKLQAIEERIRAADSMAQTTADKLEKAISELQARQDAQQTDQSESQRQSQLITQLSDALDKLSARLTASEAQTAGAMAGLEDHIGEIESRANQAPLDRRLQSLEQSLAEFGGRLENAERSTTDTAREVEGNLRDLSARLDQAEGRRHTPEKSDASQPSPPAPLLSPHTSTHMLADTEANLRPMVEHTSFREAVHASFGTRVEPPPYHEDESGEDAPLVLDTPFHHDAEPAAAEPAAGSPLDESSESYLAAARRSALAAHTEAPQGFAGLGRFNWSGEKAVEEQPAESSGPMRFVLVAGIAVIAVGAVVAGVMLSRGLIQSPATMSEAPETVVPIHRAAHTLPTHAKIAPMVASAPTSPAIPPAAAASTKLPGTPQPSDASTTTSPAVSAVQASIKTPPIADRLNTLAAAGNSKAELLLGLHYLDGEGTQINEAEAAKWLERAAEKNEAIAAYRLGTLYERGHGVPANPAMAVQWYAAAAKLGNRKAMHNLAVSYAEGSGAPKDLTKAVQWFSKAAALGLGDSEFNLAVLYERGMGVQQSLIDAYKWYAIAAAQGDAESKVRLEVIATQLSADERAAAQKAAAEFRPLPLDRNANVPPDPSSLG